MIEIFFQNLILKDFPNDYNKFNQFVLDLDRRLASIIVQAFDDCNGLQSAFKVILKYK